MTRLISRATLLVAATVLVTATATPSYAQGATANKVTHLTFSRPVQVPGATLPAGAYVFRIANPAAQTIWQVFDASGRHLITQFFLVPTGNRSIQQINAADGRPLVTFHETPQGTTPALRVLFYPTDQSGSEFVYPREQALQIAAASHQPVLATDSNATKGGTPTVVTVGADASTTISR